MKVVVAGRAVTTNHFLALLAVLVFSAFPACSHPVSFLVHPAVGVASVLSSFELPIASAACPGRLEDVIDSLSDDLQDIVDLHCHNVDDLLSHAPSAYHRIFIAAAYNVNSDAYCSDNALFLRCLNRD